ncbi:MAG: YfhO family protein, partial [Planctomycetota bacterium]
ALVRNGFELAYRNDKEMIAFFENPEALPRAFAVTSCEWASSDLTDDEAVKKEALARICAPDFDPSETVVLEIPYEDSLHPRPDRQGREPEITLDKYAPLEVLLHAKMHDARGFLVLTDTHYPGWEALVDGSPVPIERADYAFRAVFLGEGDHTIQFRYAPDTFRHGLLATVAALILAGIWGAGLVWLSVRNRKPA